MSRSKEFTEMYADIIQSRLDVEELIHPSPTVISRQLSDKKRERVRQRKPKIKYPLHVRQKGRKIAVDLILLGFDRAPILLERWTRQNRLAGHQEPVFSLS